MNYRIVLHIIGQVILIEAALLLLPLLVSLYYGEAIVPFLVTILIAALLGGGLVYFSRPQKKDLFVKEGLVITSMAWLALSLVGMLPFYISGEIPSFFDALFETVSGFTTTGASILTDVSALSRGMLFWRSFSHWIGGMGILVFVMAIVGRAPARSMNILKAEMPGPHADKLTPRPRDTAKILYLIYSALTAVEIIALIIGGMPLFDSIVHALSTAGTGGFGIRPDSIGGYSPTLQWIITVFMFLFGINFNLYYWILLHRFRSFPRSRELGWYCSIIGVSTLLITINILPIYHTLGAALRKASFHVVSLITTAGFATADYTLWPAFSQGIIFILMFIGGCAGSTAGGLKVSRVMLLGQTIKTQLSMALHPRAYTTARFEHKPVSDDSLRQVSSYFLLYILSIAVVFLLICYEPFGLETNLTAAISCFNNVGPGLGLIGPAGSYAAYSPLSKLILSVAMLLGRLEIYPLLLTLSPAFWRKK